MHIVFYKCVSECVSEENGEILHKSQTLTLRFSSSNSSKQKTGLNCLNRFVFIFCSFVSAAFEIFDEVVNHDRMFFEFVY